MIYFIEHIRKIENKLLEKKYIGICSTQEKAIEVIEKFKKYDGFKNFPDKFRIKKYLIDRYKSEDRKEISRVYLLGFYQEYDDDTEDSKVFNTRKSKKIFKKI